VIVISIKEMLGPALLFGAGATLGQEHFAAILEKIRADQTTDADRVVVFDYTNVDDVSASYVKATLLAVHQCGRLAAGGLLAAEVLAARASLEPLDIFVIVVGANDDVRACINDVFAANCLAVLAGGMIVDSRLQSCELLGVIEAKALRTLELAARVDEVTAALLFAMNSNEGITVTGWNNRLADLHRQLLLRRQTSGRQHTYRPLVKGDIHYGKVLSRK
jgi:hypothetical protein